MLLQSVFNFLENDPTIKIFLVLSLGVTTFSFTRTWF